MITQEITVVNKLGLHARAASKLVKTAAGFESQITIIKDTQEVDAKSIMGILMLAATQGTNLKIHVEGADEEDAMEIITGMFANFFGEGE